MNTLTHPHSPWRIFAVSLLATVGAFVGVLLGFGGEALLVTAVLIAVEVAFSFDNAIVNAKVLKTMSPFWQKMFLTVGAAIAIFGMRVIFPIVLVAATTDLTWREVISLALHQPEQYAKAVESSHVILSAFAGTFLLMLALHFFVDDTRKVLWFREFERSLQKFASRWAPAAITAFVLVLATLAPFNHERLQTFLAGLAGILVYTVVHGLSEYLGKSQSKQAGAVARVGIAGLATFLYLEVLDASFSFDSVLGAFAVTKDVIFIAIGLGIGALWVRSLTIFMVRRGTLDNYDYIEHGAHYTIAVLALILLVNIFVNIPEVFTGFAGVAIIGASIVASRRSMARRRPKVSHS